MISKKTWQGSYQALPVKADTCALELFQMGTPALSTLGKDSDGEMVGIAVFMTQIVSVLEFMGIKWTNPQIWECAQLAYDEYHWFSLAELKQFFTRVKKGDYSSNKNLNPAILLEFITSYADEMQPARYNYFSQKAQKTSWVPPENPVSDEKFKEVMENIIDMLTPEEDKTIGEQVGGEENFEQLKQAAAAKARQIGITDEQLNETINE